MGVCWRVQGVRVCERSLGNSTPDLLERGSWTSLSVLTVDTVPGRVVWACMWSASVSSVCVCVQRMLVQHTCKPTNPPGSKGCIWTDFGSQEQQCPGPADHWIKQLLQDL